MRLSRKASSYTNDEPFLLESGAGGGGGGFTHDTPLRARPAPIEGRAPATEKEAKNQLSIAHAQSAILESLNDCPAILRIVAEVADSLAFIDEARAVTQGSFGIRLARSASREVQRRQVDRAKQEAASLLGEYGGSDDVMAIIDRETWAPPYQVSANVALAASSANIKLYSAAQPRVPSDVALKTVNAGAPSISSSSRIILGQYVRDGDVRRFTPTQNVLSDIAPEKQFYDLTVERGGPEDKPYPILNNTSYLTSHSKAHAHSTEHVICATECASKALASAGINPKIIVRGAGTPGIGLGHIEYHPPSEGSDVCIVLSAIAKVGERADKSAAWTASGKIIMSRSYIAEAGGHQLLQAMTGSSIAVCFLITGGLEVAITIERLGSIGCAAARYRLLVTASDPKNCPMVVTTVLGLRGFGVKVRFTAGSMIADSAHAAAIRGDPSRVLAIKDVTILNTPDGLKIPKLEAMLKLTDYKFGQLPMRRSCTINLERYKMAYQSFKLAVFLCGPTSPIRPIPSFQSDAYVIDVITWWNAILSWVVVGLGDMSPEEETDFDSNTLDYQSFAVAYSGLCVPASFRSARRHEASDFMTKPNSDVAPIRPDISRDFVTTLKRAGDRLLNEHNDKEDKSFSQEIQLMHTYASASLLVLNQDSIIFDTFNLTDSDDGTNSELASFHSDLHPFGFLQAWNAPCSYIEIGQMFERVHRTHHVSSEGNGLTSFTSSPNLSEFVRYDTLVRNLLKRFLGAVLPSMSSTKANVFIDYIVDQSFAVTTSNRDIILVGNARAMYIAATTKRPPSSYSVECRFTSLVVAHRAILMSLCERPGSAYLSRSFVSMGAVLPPAIVAPLKPELTSSGRVMSRLSKKVRTEVGCILYINAPMLLMQMIHSRLSSQSLQNSPLRTALSRDIRAAQCPPEGASRVAYTLLGCSYPTVSTISGVDAAVCSMSPTLLESAVVLVTSSGYLVSYDNVINAMVSRLAATPECVQTHDGGCVPAMNLVYANREITIIVTRPIEESDQYIVHVNPAPRTSQIMKMFDPSASNTGYYTRRGDPSSHVESADTLCNFLKAVI